MKLVSEQLSDTLETKLHLRDRVLATIVLLAIAGALLWLSSLGFAPAWLADVACGFIVLGGAGIWISYFAERQAVISLKRSIASSTHDIETRFSILKAVMQNQYPRKPDIFLWNLQAQFGLPDEE